MMSALPVSVRPRRTRSRGFTMIELIVVIVILGVLAATALPRFTDLRSDAEKAVVEGFVGAVRSAQQLAFAGAVAADIGYTSPQQMSLISVVRCDSVAELNNGGASWQGHHVALAGVREKIFDDPTATACSGDTITFATKSSRVITITNSSSGIQWTASPAY